MSGKSWGGWGLAWWLAVAVAAQTPFTGLAQVRRVGDVLPDSTVRFKTGSTDLTDVSEATLDRLAALLKERPELEPVQIVGHADDRGDEPLNVRLSLGRAKQVRAALVARGIRASRMQAEGVGSTEPLSPEKTEAARAKNRRVEIWTTPRGPVARLSRVERRVEAQEPATPEWRRAQRDQKLRRLSRVRTLRRSASEISFPKDDRVTMGPKSLAVVYGSPQATRRSRRSTADVEVEAGSLFAALAEREARVIDVEARSGRMTIRSKRTRVNADALRRQATIEVYDGETEVESAGKEVTVPRGYGTRVRDDKPPDPPRRLPAPPRWSTTETVFRLADEPVTLGWTPAPKTVAAELQLGVGHDVDISVPVRLQRVDGSTVTTTMLAGVYVARLAGIDDYGLVGPSGAPRAMVVLPKPRMVEGATTALARPAPDAPLKLPAPGALRLFAPPGALVSIQGTSSTVAVDIDLFASKTVIIGVKALDGGPMRYMDLPVDVPTHRVQTEVGQVQRSEGGLSIPFDVRVIDENGHGVDDLTFRVGGVDAPSGRLLTSTAAASLLAPCHCEEPVAATLAERLGDGRYRWTLTATTTALLPTTVRFFTRSGARAVETPVPPTFADQVEAGTAPRPERGPFVALHAGSWFGTREDPVFQLSASAGARLPLRSGLALDASGQGRWFRRRDRGEDVDIFPLTARVSLAYTAWPADVYLGGGAGVRVGDVDPKPVGEVFLGMLIPVSVVDIDVEAGYTAAGSGDLLDELAGWGLRVGLRWMP